MILIQTLLVLAIAMAPWVLLITALVKYEDGDFWGWLITSVVAGWVSQVLLGA